MNLFKASLLKNERKDYDKYHVKSSKHFPSSVREWNNSIYTFNKEGLILIPNTTLSAIKLIRSFFTLFNFLIEKKIRRRKLLIRKRKLSSNRVYTSNGEFKHTNNKVIITLYVFNRQKQNYISSLKKRYLNIIFPEKKLWKVSFFKKFELIKNKSLSMMYNLNKEKYIIIKAIKKSNNTATQTQISKYINNFYSRFINKSFKKLKLYFYYKQLVYINRSKYNYTYLQYLKNPLSELYNKNIEFNLVNLKRFYLNSDIMSESITLKLTKNRRGMLRYLNKLRNKVKIIGKTILSNEPLNINDNLHKQNNFSSPEMQEKFLINNVIYNIKYKGVSGFRLESKGRLSRRYTASRSVSKVRYKGNLLNIDSSYRGLSSVLLKGNLKSNIQYTKLNSKSRIGSFGIKGWVSGN